MLRDYILEVQSMNPGTTVKVDIEPGTDPNSDTRQFRRIYFCLGALKEGFKACLRELLGLDGNNGTYPVAYAIVEAETKILGLGFWSV